MAVALELAESSRAQHGAWCRSLRDRLWDGIRAEIPDVAINGPVEPEARLASHLNVSVRGVQGETVLLSLDMQGVAASAGSACTTGNSEPSHVLLAMGLGEERARSSLRFTVGRANTEEQIDEAVEILAETVARVRELSAVRSSRAPGW